MKAYCVVNTKACPGASVLGPGALGALKSLLESGVAGAQNKQNIHIYIDIYIYRERYIKMLPYMYLLPLSDDEVERLDAADAGAAVFYLEKLTFINI